MFCVSCEMKSRDRAGRRHTPRLGRWHPTCCTPIGGTPHDSLRRTVHAASEQAQNAQEAADNDIAGARASFEKTREDYRHSRTEDLNNLDRKIAAQALESLETATAATWDEAKANLDKDWDALKSAVDKAQ